jgi:ABC-type dipeptide/oligopeptide/nickel transport system ATPase component
MALVKTLAYDELRDAASDKDIRKKVMGQIFSLLKKYPRRSFVTAILVPIPLFVLESGSTLIPSLEVAAVLSLGVFVVCVVLLWFIPPALAGNLIISPGSSGPQPPSLPSSDSDVLTLCIFGLGGSGKTTFIRNAFREHKILSETQETQNFCLYEFPCSEFVNSQQMENYVVRIADYAGQDPSQILCPGIQVNKEQKENYDQLRSFITRADELIVDVIIFIVDVIGKPGDYSVVNDEELTKKLLLDPQEAFNQIKIRLDDHEEYISKGVIQNIFSAMNSENLKLVLLLVNKNDVLESLIGSGSSEQDAQVDGEEIKNYVKEKFDRRQDIIAEFCKKASEGRSEIKFKSQYVSFSDFNDIHKIKSYVFSEVLSSSVQR